MRAALREWVGLELGAARERAVVADAAAREVRAHLMRRGPADGSVEGAAHLGEPGEVGVVVAAAHLGRHRRVGPAIAGLGHEVIEVALPAEDLSAELPGPSKLAELARRWGDVTEGVTVVPVNHGLRPAVRALRRGAVVINPGDGRWGGGWSRVPFLTGSAWMATGPGRLAALGRARLVRAYVRPDGGVVIDGWHRSGDPTAWFAAGLSSWVRSDPASYLWRLGTLHRLQAAGVERFFE